MSRNVTLGAGHLLVNRLDHRPLHNQDADITVRETHNIRRDSNLLSLCDPRQRLSRAARGGDTYVT